MRLLSVSLGLSLAVTLIGAGAGVPTGCNGPVIGDGDFICGSQPPACPPGFACGADGRCHTGGTGVDGSGGGGPGGAPCPLVFQNSSQGSATGWDGTCTGQATCAPGSYVAAISGDPGMTMGTLASGFAALCAGEDAPAFPGTGGIPIAVDDAGTSVVRDRDGGTLTGWPPSQQIVLQCGAGEYVMAVSEDSFAGPCPAMDNHFHAVLCVKGGAALTDACTRRDFDDAARLDAGPGCAGWPSRPVFGECAEHEYLGGIAIDPTSRAPSALLCCAY